MRRTYVPSAAPTDPLTSEGHRSEGDTALPALTLVHQQRLVDAEKAFGDALSAHEDMREIVGPGEWQRTGTETNSASRDEWIREVRKLEKDIRGFALATLNVLAEASWGIGAVRPFRERLEAQALEVLTWALAKVNPEDFSLLRKSHLTDAVNQDVAKWIQKADREFRPAWRRLPDALEKTGAPDSLDGDLQPGGKAGSAPDVIANDSYPDAYSKSEPHAKEEASAPFQPPVPISEAMDPVSDLSDRLPLGEGVFAPEDADDSVTRVALDGVRADVDPAIAQVQNDTGLPLPVPHGGADREGDNDGDLGQVICRKPPFFQYEYTDDFPASEQLVIEKARLEANREYERTGLHSYAEDKRARLAWFWRLITAAATAIGRAGASNGWGANRRRETLDDFGHKAAEAAGIAGKQGLWYSRIRDSETWRALDYRLLPPPDETHAGQPSAVEYPGETKAAPLNVPLILKWIKEEGWSNKELADKLKTSERAISSLRNNGQYHGSDLVNKLASLMGRDPLDLYLLPPEAST